MFGSRWVSCLNSGVHFQHIFIIDITLIFNGLQFYFSRDMYKVSYIVLLNGRVLYPSGLRPILGEVLSQLQVCSVYNIINNRCFIT